MLIVKPTRYTNFSNLFLGKKILYVSDSSSVHHQQFFTVHTTMVPSWSCSQDVSKPVWHIPLLCVRWKTPDDGQRNCPKHVEFYSKNKFQKLVYLVGFIVRHYIRIGNFIFKHWCQMTYLWLRIGSCAQAVSKPVSHIPLLCVQCETTDDGQRNCPKHVEIYSKNKFEKIVHLVGFIIRNFHDARPSESQESIPKLV